MLKQQMQGADECVWVMHVGRPAPQDADVKPNSFTVMMILQAANYKKRGHYKEAVKAVKVRARHIPLQPNDPLPFVLAVVHMHLVCMGQRCANEVHGLVYFA